MQGMNKLVLCGTQMIQITQEWIDRNLATKPKVVSVSYKSQGAHDHSFEVRLGERASAEPSP